MVGEVMFSFKAAILVFDIYVTIDTGASSAAELYLAAFLPLFRPFSC